MFRPLTAAARRGLTLIELVVVMAILAALAALIIPRLDFLKAQADHASAASNTGDLATMIQTYKSTNQGKYPALDLLIDDTGSAYSKVYSGGGSPIVATTLDGAAAGASWYRSLLEGGLRYGITNSSGATNASNSGSGPIVDMSTLAAGGTLKVAELQSTGYFAPAIFNAVFPARFDPITGTNVAAGTYDGTKVKLIALGIGPNNGMIGNVMSSTPIESDTDDPNSVYCRYIAIFAVYNNGSLNNGNVTPAQLKMVVDHRFKQIDKHLDQFKAAGPTGGLQ